MKKLNNKGFTLIEVLAVIAIIAILGIIAVPSVIKTINNGKDASYNILVDDIKIAGQQLIEELEYADSTLCHYDNNGTKDNCPNNNDNGKIIITKENNSGNTRQIVEVNLQTLVSNGFLTGTNRDEADSDSSNKNSKIIFSPKNNEDIGSCTIKIIKEVKTTENYKTTYSFENLSEENNNCPTTEEYQK